MTTTTRLPRKATNACEALQRYKSKMGRGKLRQGLWNSSDGESCALGAIAPDVHGVSDVPAAIMPRWLAREVPAIFDHLPKEDAIAWGLSLYEQLTRIDGNVPFLAFKTADAFFTGRKAALILAELKKEPTPRRQKPK